LTPQTLVSWKALKLNDAALTKRHHQIQLIRILEREFERYDKRIVDQSQNSPLRKDMGNFPWPASDMRLPNSLEGVDPLCVLLPNLHHFPKAPLTDHFEQIECFDREQLVAELLKVDFEVERAGTVGRCVPLV
jgi:hypothetical protein